MMENFEQARLTTDRLKQLDNIHSIKLQEKNEFFNMDEFAVNKQNFNFGANILKTNTMSTSSSTLTTNTNGSGEVETKTNNEILETTSITFDMKESLIPDDPLHVDEIANQVKNDIREDEDVNAIEEEEEDSYQTDNEHSQLSQESTNLLQTSNDDEDIDDSDDSSSDSDFSDLSGLSDMSGREWKPINQRPLNWVQKQIHSGANPREILSKFLPSSAQRISPELTDMTLWRILASMLSEPPRRKKLSYVNTFDDIIHLLNKSKNIIVLTGAGVSVSCGIPDFRSSDGIYSRLAKDFPDLPDPQAMFDINYFSRDPRPFFKFAREIYPGQFKPSPCHRFIKMLEQKQKLLRNYTQNIDTLEQVAGIQNVIECHGSFSTASCTKCKFKCDADSIRSDIFAQRIPVCPRCQPNVEQSVDASEPVSEFELRHLVENGIMKPDIVFFGEGLPDEFHTVMANDKDKCDLLIVMGSSLKVRPVALIPSSIPTNVPQILINREQLHHLEFDVELLGDGDVIINQICHRLGEDWKDICFDDEVLTESKELIALAEDQDIDDEDTAKEVSTDIETSSVKSNHSSSELVLQSATAYSDSGFESSSTCSTKKDGEFLPPDYLDEPMESSATFGGSCDYRHLSIDSSKDSGILGDASNSALPPAFNNFADSVELKKECLNMPASTTQSISTKPSGVDNLNNTKTSDIKCSQNEQQSIRRQLRHQSAAERLYKGTYYSHENTASYVFPGAQVSWGSDLDTEDEEDLDGRHGDMQINDDDDTNHGPLSPLMTPSVENEMVKAIATNTTSQEQTTSTSNTFTNVMSSNTCPPKQQHQPQKKRQSCDQPIDESATSEAIHDDNVNKAMSCSHSPPPSKKRRDSAEHKTFDISISSNFVSESS